MLFQTNVVDLVAAGTEFEDMYPATTTGWGYVIRFPGRKEKISQ